MTILSRAMKTLFAVLRPALPPMMNPMIAFGYISWEEALTVSNL